MINDLFPNRPRLNRALQIAAVVAGLLGFGGAGVFLAGGPKEAAGREPAPAIAGTKHLADRRTAEEPDTPSITGKTTAAPHTLVRLKANNLPKGAAALWSIYPRKGADVATTRGDLLEFAAPPGVYEIELTVIATGEAGISARRFYETVTVGDGKAPPLTPPPGTPPVTPPSAGKLDPVGAIGRIVFGRSGCTATVIHPRRADGRWDVLTAAHCVSGVGAKGTLSTKAGGSIAVRVVVHQTRPDLAWLVTERADLADLSYAKLAEANPAAGVKMWHQGYGVHIPGNREDGTVLVPENSDGQTQFRISVSSGDSGGGMLRDDTNEVISTVCCTSRLSGTGNVWGASVRSIRTARPGAVNLDDLPLPAEHGGPLPECESCSLLDVFGRLLGR